MTPTVVVAPLELTGESGGAKVTVHLVGDGPVDVVTVEPHPADAQAKSHAAM
jgi:DNA-binding protein YbaB